MDITTAIEYGLKHYSYCTSQMEGFHALEQNSLMGLQTTVPVEVYRLSGNNYSRMTNDDSSKYMIEVVAGAYTKTISGPAKCIEIRTPISVVEDNSYSKEFVDACCAACDEIHRRSPEIRNGFDIKLLNGYVMTVFHVREDYFMSLPQEQYCECLSYFLFQLERNTRQIRAYLRSAGFASVVV